MRVQIAPWCLFMASTVLANPLINNLFGRQATACNADNCARAVTGTSNQNPNQAGRRADCASFFSTTLIPVTTTYTTVYSSTFVSVFTTTQTTTQTVNGGTVTVNGGTVTVTRAPAKMKRAAATTTLTRSPSAVPAYASPCSGTARYSSACSCFSVTRGTTTAATSTVTSTITAVTTTSTTTLTISTVLTTSSATTTSITTVTVDPVDTTCRQYKLQIVGGIVSGNTIDVARPNPNNPATSNPGATDVYISNRDLSTAAIFTIPATGLVYDPYYGPTYRWAISTTFSYSAITGRTSLAGGYVYIYCSVTPAGSTGPLSCRKGSLQGDLGTLGYCDNTSSGFELAFYTGDGSDGGCTALTISAIASC